MEKKLKILILHLDLGIGGAERLIVDTALALQDLGHEVRYPLRLCAINLNRDALGEDLDLAS
jgi:hypothetical protein